MTAQRAKTSPRRPEPPRAGGARRLDALLADGQLTESRTRAVASALVERHARADPVPDLGPTPDFHRSALEAVAARGIAIPADLRRRIERGLLEGADRLLARAGRSRILAQVHELGLEDVELDGSDRARIDPAERRALGVPFDSALEVASLSFQLTRCQRADLAERLVSHYANQAEDFELYPVLELLESLCALRQLERDAGAERRSGGVSVPSPAARSPLATPVVVAMSGPVASGKSTLARALADELAAPLAVADRIRDHLVHGVPGRPIHEAGWASGFEPGFGPRVYTEMFRRGEIVLTTGRPIVFDACFPTPFERAAARSIAARYRVPFLFVDCRVDPATQRRRLAERDAAASEADGSWVEISQALASRRVPASEIAASERVEVDTAESPARALEQLLRGLPGSLLQAGGNAGG